MPGNDWNKLGNDIRNIVQDAIETGDYGRLNRDLGVTLENARVFDSYHCIKLHAKSLEAA